MGAHRRLMCKHWSLIGKAYRRIWVLGNRPTAPFLQQSQGNFNNGATQQINSQEGFGMSPFYSCMFSTTRLLCTNTYLLLFFCSSSFSFTCVLTLNDDVRLDAAPGVTLALDLLQNHESFLSYLFGLNWTLSLSDEILDQRGKRHIWSFILIQWDFCVANE